MAGGSIKGITIRFEGDTTRLDKALRQIQNSTKDIDKELRNVDRALKFNPTSVDLWRQKQDLLKQKIKETENNLKELKSIQAQMDAQGVDKNSEAYRRVQREIIEAESKLKTFNAELKKVGQVNLRAASEQFKEWGNSLESAGQKMSGLSKAAAGVVASLGAISYKAGTAADDLNTMSKVTGISTDNLQKYSYAADLVDVSVDSIAKSNKKLAKNAYEAANGSKSQKEAFDALGVSVTDSNGELRDSEDIFQDVISALGQMSNETERDALAQKLMGKSASELNPLIEDGGETYKMVADTMKKYDLDYVDQETLNKANEFNDALDTMKLLGSVAFAQVGSQLAAYLAPALEKVVGLMGRFSNWLSKLDPKVLAVVGAIAAFVAALAPLLILLGKVAFGISSILNLAATLGISITALAGPIGIAIAAIAAIIAIGVLLYKNWDLIKAKAIALKTAVVQAFTNLKANVIGIWNAIKSSTTAVWNAIKSTITNAIQNAVSAVKTKISDVKSSISDAWSSIKEKTASAWSDIKDKITKPFTTAKEKISDIVSKIKGFFPINLGKILHFEIPTISVDGGEAPWGIGGKGKAPSFNISWASHAAGGIFARPTLLMGADGAIHQVGEAGAEAILPLSVLWRKMEELQGGSNETNIVININGSNKDPREIAEEVKRVLIRETNQRRLAWQ